MNIAPERFSEKIPNKAVLRDFFVNQCKLYAPPQREMTAQFCRDILRGKKKLLKQSEVQRVEEIP